MVKIPPTEIHWHLLDISGKQIVDIITVRRFNNDNNNGKLWNKDCFEKLIHMNQDDERWTKEKTLSWQWQD